MATNQENIIAGIESKLSLSGLNYNEAIFELAENYGITVSDFNSTFAQLLKIIGGSDETDISGLIANYANRYFDNNVNSINSLTPATGSAYEATFSGCKLLLDATDSTTIAASPVATWNDISGQSNDVAEGTADNRPTYSNPTVTFDGVNDRLGIGYASAGDLRTANFHIFAVVTPTDKGTAPYSTIISTQALSNGGYWLNITDTGLIRTITNQTGLIPSTGITFDQKVLISYSCDGTTIRIRKNGVELDNTALGAAIVYPTTNFYVGAADWGGSINDTIFDGGMHEILFYDNVKSGTDLTNLETFLINKHNIST